MERGDRQKEAGLQLAAYARQARIFFHYAYSNDPLRELLVAPYPKNSSTPVGVYAYEARTYLAGKTTFAKDRPWIFVLRARPGLRGFDIANMPKRQADETLAELAKLLDPGVYEAIVRRALKFEVSFLTPGSLAYYTIVKSYKKKWTESDDFRPAPTSIAPVDPRYASHLLKKLGYDAVVDVTGTMWSSEHEQVCFLSSSAFDTLDIVRNPAVARKNAASSSDYDEFVDDTLQSMAGKFPGVRLTSFAEFQRFLDAVVPRMIHKYMLLSLAMKVCSTISPEFAEIAASAGFPVLIQHVPGHVVNIVLTTDGPYRVDLSYIQFLCKHDIRDKYEREEAWKSFGALYRDPLKAIQVDKLPESHPSSVSEPRGEYDALWNPVKHFAEYNIQETEEFFPDIFDRLKGS